jgi:hypothetical protein
MRPKENIEKFVRVRKPHITTSRQMDKRTLDDSFAAMDQTIRTKSAELKPSAHGIIIRSRVIKLAAAAAVIIVGIGLAIYFGPADKVDTPIVTEVAKSPAEMQAILSLSIAYRRGGIEAVEDQCRKAIEMLGPRPAEITTQQMLKEFNGM